MVQLPNSMELPTAWGTKPSTVRFTVLAWLCAAVAISYISRSSISVAESTIRSELGLTKETMSLVMALFYIPYALAQIPGGMLSERWGSRRAIPILAAGWSTATAAMAAAWIPSTLVTAWLLNGLFQAGLLPCCARSMSKWFPASRRAFASGTLASFMSIGSVIGSAGMGFLLQWIGWQQTFVCIGVLGITWAVAFFVWFRDEPADHPRVNQAELTLIDAGRTAQPAVTEGDVSPWSQLLTSPVVWCICGQQFCRAAGQVFFSSWFATYLQEARGVSVAKSGVLNSIPLAAVILGALLGGIISDGVLARTGSRRLARQGVAATCMFSCAAFVVAACFVRDPVWAVMTISAGTFVASIGGPSAYAITMDIGGRHVAKLFSCMNMVGNLGAATFILGTPWFAQQTSNKDAVLVLFGVLWIAAGMFWLLANPNRDVFGRVES